MWRIQTDEMQPGKGKVPNAAQMETTNQPGQGSKTCAKDKGNIKLEKGGPR